MSSESAHVRRLPAAAFEDVVSVLCAAFSGYPVMRFILKDAGDDYDARLWSLVGYFTASRFARDWPVLGVEEADRLRGAANVTPPQPKPAPPALEARYGRLCSHLGDAAIARFHAFAAATERLEPEPPHTTLGMIGVLPGSQGKGYARPLLEAVHELSRNDPGSCGVALTTETPANLPLYEHFGYRVLGQEQVEELTTWTLYRPDETS